MSVSKLTLSSQEIILKSVKDEARKAFLIHKFLSYVPKAACMVKALPVICVLGEDVDLRINPDTKFEFLKFPTSLHACLRQLVKAQHEAFCLAQNSMSSIYDNVISIPEWLKEIMIALEKLPDEDSQFMVDYHFERLLEATNFCTVTVESVAKEFKNITNICDELVGAIMAKQNEGKNVEKDYNAKKVETQEKEKFLEEGKKRANEAMYTVRKNTNQYHSDIDQSNRFLSKFVDLLTFSRDSRQHNLDRVEVEVAYARKNAEEIQRQVDEDAREYIKLLSDLQKLDKDKTDLSEVLLYTQKCIKLISNANQALDCLHQFFKYIENVVKKLFNGPVKEFTRLANRKTHNEQSHRILCQEYAKACVVPFILPQTFKLYQNLSSEHAMPAISEAKKNFGLSRTEAQAEEKTLLQQSETLFQEVEAKVNEINKFLQSGAVCELAAIGLDISEAVESKRVGTPIIQELE